MNLKGEKKSQQYIVFINNLEKNKQNKRILTL